MPDLSEVGSKGTYASQTARESVTTLDWAKQHDLYKPQQRGQVCGIHLKSQATFSTTEMALALNRYLCLAVLPLITKCAPLFAGTEHRAIMVDSMLHTVYRLSRGRSLTKAQRDVIEDCLMALCR